jgi:hypothetical protein
MNDTFSFVAGKTTTDWFFGDDPITHQIKHHKISVGSAFRRDTAIQTVANTSLGNYCIVYLDDAKSASNRQYVFMRY